MHHRSDNGRAGAANFSAGGKNFDAYDVLGRNEREPGRGNGGLAGEISNATVDHCLDDLGVGLVIENGVGILDDDNAGKRRWCSGLNLKSRQPQ